MNPSVADIQKVVGRYFGISQRELLAQRRQRDLVRARQIGMYLTKLMTLRSLPEIGRMYGGRDHTTVLHACRKMEREIPTDPELAAEIGKLQALVSKAVPTVHEFADQLQAQRLRTEDRAVERAAAILADRIIARAETPEPPPHPVMVAAQAVADAVAAFDQAQYSRGETAARNALEKQARALAKLLQRPK